VTATVLVAGATGAMGRRVLALGRRARPDLTWLAGTHRRPAPRGIPSRATDLLDRRGLEGTLGGVDVLVNAVGPYTYDPEPAVEACLRRGVHYVDLAESDDYLRAVRRTARSWEGTLRIVPGCSTIPGLVRTLAEPLCDRRGLAGIRVLLCLGSRNPVTPGLLFGLLRPLGRPSEQGQPYFGRLERHHDHLGGDRLYGRWPMPTALENRTGRAPTSFFVGFDRAPLTRLLSRLAPVSRRLSDGNLERLCRWWIPVLRLLRPLGTYRGVLRIEAVDGRGRALDAVEVRSHNRGLDVPALPPVWAVERLTGRCHLPGPVLIGLDDLVTAPEALGWLERYGLETWSSAPALRDERRVRRAAWPVGEAPAADAASPPLRILGCGA
jgi:hypothetical protein